MKWNIQRAPLPVLIEICELGREQKRWSIQHVECFCLIRYPLKSWRLVVDHELLAQEKINPANQSEWGVFPRNR